MPVTNAGNAPPQEPPQEPHDLSPLRYDFSHNQSWIVGVHIACHRCPFGKTLTAEDAFPVDTTGLHTAYHFVYRDGSRSGWGSGVFICPACGTYLFFEKELLSPPGPGLGGRGQAIEAQDLWDFGTG